MMSSILLAYLLALKLSPGSGHLVKFKDPRETGKFEEFTRSVIETQVSHRPGKRKRLVYFMDTLQRITS